MNVAEEVLEALSQEGIDILFMDTIYKQQEKIKELEQLIAIMNSEIE